MKFKLTLHPFLYTSLTNSPSEISSGTVGRPSAVAQLASQMWSEDGLARALGARSRTCSGWDVLQD